MNSGLLSGCDIFEPDLPKNELNVYGVMGYEAGYSWGYYNPLTMKVFWVTPDKYEPSQRQFYIPKGYLTLENFTKAKLPDGTPYNEKQKKQAMDTYNWLFYKGYCDGAQDNLHGKPDKTL